MVVTGSKASEFYGVFLTLLRVNRGFRGESEIFASHVVVGSDLSEVVPSQS